MMRLGIASDHDGFALKGQMAESLRASGYEAVDFGAHQLDPGDDYPDFIIPLAKAVAAGEVERGVALSGSSSSGMAAQLLDEGAASFVKSWKDLMECIASNSVMLNAD